MRKYGLFRYLLSVLALMTVVSMPSDAVSSPYDPSPPFKQDLLERVICGGTRIRTLMKSRETVAEGWK
jgi:hypothetical protein